MLGDADAIDAPFVSRERQADAQAVLLEHRYDGRCFAPRDRSISGMSLDVAIPIAVPNGNSQTKIFAVPLTEPDHWADAPHVAIEPVQRSRSRPCQHEVVEQHGVEETAAQVQANHGAVAGRAREDEVDVILRVLARGARERLAVAHEYRAGGANQVGANV